MCGAAPPYLGGVASSVSKFLAPGVPGSIPVVSSLVSVAPSSSGSRCFSLLYLVVLAEGLEQLHGLIVLDHMGCFSRPSFWSHFLLAAQFSQCLHTRMEVDLSPIHVQCCDMVSSSLCSPGCINVK